MINKYEIVGSGSVRPDAERILFCDGTGGSLFDPATDLELSHWRPNTTPAEYRAGTSTEICFRFLDNPRPGLWTVAVNNHVDVDGILSVYALIHSEHALAHRQTLIAAAEVGDFWGWGERPAQRVFQGITRLMNEGGEPKAIYAEAFRRIPNWIDGSDPETGPIDDSLAPLQTGRDLIREGQIPRREIGPRFVQYLIPQHIAGDDDDRATYVPEFNEAISHKAILWPQVRALWDAERVCLVSVERSSGWFHDLCFPGYLWADTEGKWLVPGFTFHDGMSRYEIHNERLLAAFEELQREETAPGQWSLGGTSGPFGDELQERFPVVGRFLNEDGRITRSFLGPDPVANALRNVFD